MSSQETKAPTSNQSKAQKSAWVKPRVDRLDTRDAESSHGAIPDGGGGFQGS